MGAPGSTGPIGLVVVAHTDRGALEATLRSIAIQTRVSAVVVVDIGEAVVRPDQTALLSCGLDPASSLWLALPGLNRYEAINRGVAACCSSYLMVLHEGDKLADPHVLADCEAHLKGMGRVPEVLYGERIKYLGAHWYYKPPRSPEQVALGMFVELSCMLIRRDVFQVLTFDASFTEAGDYAFVCQLRRLRPDASWVRLDRILVQVVLDKMHEGHLGRKLKEDWRVQREWVRSGLLMRVLVLVTRLVSQGLRRLCRLTLGYPGFKTGAVPVNGTGRAFVE